MSKNSDKISDEQLESSYATDSDLETLRSEIESQKEKIEDIGRSLDKNVEDIRGKIIKIGKMARSIDELQEKLSTNIEDTNKDVSENKDKIESINDQLSELHEEVTGISEMHAQLRDDFEKLNENTTKLAHNHIELRDSYYGDTVSDLRKEAMKKGVTEGKCSNCRNLINLSLFNSIECPFCGEKLDSVKPRRIRSNIIKTRETDNEDK